MDSNSNQLIKQMKSHSKSLKYKIEMKPAHNVEVYQRIIRKIITLDERATLFFPHSTQQRYSIFFSGLFGIAVILV